MALEIVGQHAQPARRPAHFLQRVAQLARRAPSSARPACWRCRASRRCRVCRVASPRRSSPIPSTAPIELRRSPSAASSPIALNGTSSSFLMMLDDAAPRSPRGRPGWSAARPASCDQSTVAGGASGKKSKATNSAPVSRLPVRSCARTPCATSVSIICVAHGLEVGAGRQVADLDAEPLPRRDGWSPGRRTRRSWRRPVR